MQTCEATRIEELEDRIGLLGSAVVAFSGGVDSSLVAALAARALGDRALAVTAVSPALATGELDGASLVAAAVGIRHETITTAELERAEYRRNDHDRCYHCKTELYSQLSALAARRGYDGAALGRQRRRSRRLEARPAGGRGARRRPSAARGRGQQGGGTGARPSARGPERGEARLSVPRLAPALRDAGRARDARPGRPRRARPQGARLPRAARPSLRRARQGPARRRRAAPRALAGRPEGHRGCSSRRGLRAGRGRPGAVPLRIAQRGLRRSAPGR